LCWSEYQMSRSVCKLTQVQKLLYPCCSLRTKRYEAWTGRLPICSGSLVQWPLSHNRHCPRVSEAAICRVTSLLRRHEIGGDNVSEWARPRHRRGRRRHELYCYLGICRNRRRGYHHMGVTLALLVRG